MTSSEPTAADFAARSAANAAAEAERLRVEIEHRDQLLAAVYARADGLQREIERLERQLDAALEAHREAATERAELRRLLGNAQLQVHTLLRIAPPGEEPAAAPELEPDEPVAAGPAAEPPARAIHEDVKTSAPEPVAPAAAPSEAPRPRPEPAAPRGIVDDAREAWSSLRRLF